jgi:hypothetical protein
MNTETRFNDGESPSSSTASPPGPIRARSILQILGFLIWFEIIIAAYFVYHKPWPPSLDTAPINGFVDLVIALSLIALAGGLGRLLLADLQRFSALEQIAIQTAVGLGVLSIGVLAFGLLGFLRSWIAWLMLALGILLLRNEITAWMRTWRAISEGFRELDRLTKAAAWLCAWLALLALLQALAPPLKWDSLVYHLELPRRYLLNGKVQFFNDNLFVGQPQLAEMLYTWAMALRSGTTAATLGWAVGLIGLVGVGGFAKRLIGPRAGWIAATILLSGASIARGLSWAYVDLWVMLFGFGTIVMLDSFIHTRERKWLVRSGLFAGFAVSTKYTAGNILILGSVVLLVQWVIANLRVRGSTESQIASSGEEGQRLWQGKRAPNLKPLSWTVDILIFGTVALLIAAPWLLKNFAFTGNPVYPFFIPGKAVDALRQSFYAGNIPDRSLIDHLLLPIDFSLKGIEGGPIFNTTVSPLLLAFIPGMLIGWRDLDQSKRKSMLTLIVIALTVWPLWSFGSTIAGALIRTRHYYVMFPALAVLAAQGLEQVSKLKLSRIRVGWVILSLTAAVFVLTAVGEGFNFLNVNPARVVSGVQSESDYLADQLGWYGPVMGAINSLPEDSNVAFLWEPRAYYCEVTCHPDVILDRWWHLVRTIGDAEAIARNLRSEGFTHVLIYDFGIQLEQEERDQFTPADWLELANFVESELLIVQQFGQGYTLFQFADPQGAS